jgi:hypothetical protein
MTESLDLAKIVCCVALVVLVWHADVPAWAEPSVPPAEAAVSRDKPAPKPRGERGRKHVAPMDRESSGHRDMPEVPVAPQPAAPTGPVQSRPINAGFVILAGHYFPPPYTVQWIDGGLCVNDVPVPIEGPAMPARRGARPLPPPPSRLPWRQIARLEHQLRCNGLLLSLDGESVMMLPPSEAVRIMEILAGDDAPEVKVEALAKAGYSNYSSGQWATLAESFQTSDELVNRVAGIKEALKNSPVVAATTTAPSNTVACALTVSSMALTVFALGTILTHRPRRRQGWRGWSPSPTGCRLVVRCVALLILLSIFDLACTLLAVRSGGFWELNPVAEHLVGDVGTIILFKSTLIAGGAAILLAFRRYRFTQNAAWWVCVFHMVLILRWATYSSLFLT